MSATQEERAARLKAAKAKKCTEEALPEEEGMDEERRIARMLVRRHLGVLKRLAKR